MIALTSCLRAFDIHVPWYGPFVLQLLLAIFISPPGAPGFVGQFHFPIVIGLVMVAPDVDVSKAKALAIVAHLLNLIPVYAIGLFCLFWERFGFVELTRESLHAETELEAPGDGE